jgi:inositol-hexakisphosphate kinase
MTSIYHNDYTNHHSYPPSPPDSTDISPPISPPSLSNSLRPGRSISDPSPSEPPPPRSLSPITHHPKSDADSALLVSTLSYANPSTPSSRPRVSHSSSSPRSQTLPATHSTHSDLTFPTAHRTPKPLSRRSSSRSTASSSSDTSPPPPSHSRTPQHNSAGIGRKVADSLQLFKESVSLPETEVINPLAFTGACSPSHRRISSYSPGDDDDDVIGPHFEFVKRADWQEREAAAHRRERSMLTLDMVRARESIAGVSEERRQNQSRKKERVDLSKSGGLDDRTLYTKDLPRQRDTRGRPRDRQQWPEQSGLPFPPSTQPTSRAPSYHDLCLTPIVTSPPHSYPRPPSPSCSPSQCISVPVSQFQPSPDFRSPTILTSSRHARVSEISHSRSPTPIRTVSRLPLGDHRDHDIASPWTTDDESAWDSASVTSTASISSPLSPPEPLESNPGVTWPTDNEYDMTSRTPVDDDVGVDDRYHARFDQSEDDLPHIPLRPFRNQVGGHTSIYKFTKRAVCKVRVPPISL